MIFIANSHTNLAQWIAAPFEQLFPYYLRMREIPLTKMEMCLPAILVLLTSRVGACQASSKDVSVTAGNTMASADTQVVVDT